MSILLAHSDQLSCLFRENMKSVLRKKISRNSLNSEWRAGTGSFLRKPPEGWLHADELIKNNGVSYSAKYIGAVKIIESIRGVPLKQRGDIVRESICKCCEYSNMYNFKKNKVSLTHGLIGDVYLENCGVNVVVELSCRDVCVSQHNQKLFKHNIESISFSAVGEDQYKNFFGYISKDGNLGRACFIFECESGTSKEVIHTIGQVFELKYKSFLQTQPKLQPVVPSFTDPGAAMNTYENHSSPTTNEQGFLGYTRLRQEAQKKLKTNGYSSLQRREKVSVNDTTAPLDYSLGACNTLSTAFEESLATVYDNPLAAVRHSSSQPPIIAEDSFDLSDYDNPQDFVPPPGRDNVNTQHEYLTAQDAMALANNTNNDNHLNISTPVSDPYTLIHPNDDPIPPDDAHYESTVTDLKRQSWFHGALSRDDAEKLLIRDGDFLVRESTKAQGQYVISGLREGVCRHMFIVDSNGVARTRDHTFSSATELIDFHSTNNIPLSSGQNSIFLISQVNRSGQ